MARLLRRCAKAPGTAAEKSPLLPRFLLPLPLPLPFLRSRRFLRRLESSLLPVEEPETLAGRFLDEAATRTPSSEGAIAAAVLVVSIFEGVAQEF